MHRMEAKEEYARALRAGQKEAKELLDKALSKQYNVFNTVPRQDAIDLAKGLGMDMSEYKDIR